jgi:RND superfamily putative drug exporter
MARLLFRLGFFSHRHRLTVVLVWLLVLLGGGVGAATLAGETSNTFSIPGQESTTALERITEKFGAGSGGATARVVVLAPEGQTLTTPANAAAVGDLVADLAQLPGVAAASDPLNPAAPAVNADQTTGYSTVAYSAAAGGVTAEQQDALLAAVDNARDAGLTVEVTGEATQVAPHVGGVGEVVGVVIALVILAVTYGSLVAAGMNLLTAVVGVGIGVLGITIATGFADLSSTTSALAGMLGLAVGIDYALFIVTRFRQELRRGSDVGTSVATAVATAGSAVVTAGLTVVIALAGLFVVGIPFLTQMGLAAAATIVVAVLVAITLVPAVLSYLGHRALPHKQRTAAVVATGDSAVAAGRRGFLAGWITMVTRRRVLSLVLTVAALGAIAVPFFSMQTTLVQRPAEDSTQARAEQLLTDGFGAGFSGPLVVLFDGDGAPGAAAQAGGAIAALDDVAVVTPPIPNADGTAALLTVIPKSGPTSPATEQLVADLRALLADTDGPSAYVTGATAVSVDVAKALDDALPVYLALVVGLALGLLVLVFRSLLVPLVGVLGFLLTIGASLGATVAVFQWGWLADLVALDSTGPLISLTPILVIGILFGLAMDYQIFLVSRMHEAHSHGAASLDALRTGFRQAAPVVVAAALIMFVVFAGFVPEGDATLKSIAFALAAGIVFDAFVVRMVLVPAALALLGERAWWLPRWLRWLPTLDVEGADLERPVSRPRDDQRDLVSLGER